MRKDFSDMVIFAETKIQEEAKLGGKKLRKWVSMKVFWVNEEGRSNRFR